MPYPKSRILVPLFTITLWGLLMLTGLEAAGERTNIDDQWQFSLGHATDSAQDFGHKTVSFSYLAKTGFGDGPANPAFDDRGWRTVDLPHDWAVEMPFNPRASRSHGYKAVGPGFPESSVGWYRKHFQVDSEDLGKIIAVEFDGIFRNADVFVNGFFVGNEPSGYLGQRYELTDYLNYGGDNTLVVRVDASMEEGWFYEGAGIYRHVWLTKTEPLHFKKDGVWINPQLEDGEWVLHLQSEFTNQGREETETQLQYHVVDGEGNLVLKESVDKETVAPGQSVTNTVSLASADPHLWSIDDPYLYKLEAQLLSPDGGIIDSFNAHFGFRSIRWDPDKGFFLNGKHLKLVGSNNHQDHAGVGAAMPDSLQEWRIRQLKSMGNNIYRASHNPPTPEFLDACDRLGMLVIDENRLMGINSYHFGQLTRMVERDRNHPSVILWSLGNEEWRIEGNILGARITQTMQDYCHQLDPTRYTTVAISGGWGGVSHTVQVAGVNYIHQADPDQQHIDYPEQIILGTEETTTQQTRGIYARDDQRCFLPPLGEGSTGGNCEIGWKYYFERDFGAGVIFWTGFDYRGEPTPFDYPAISSQFGILDTCGFPKDSYYYLKSWWTDEPVLHLFPHWNWPGKEGEIIEVRLHSNCETAELYLNGESLGEQTMELNGHLAWQVPYESGELMVKGIWQDGTERTQRVQTTGPSQKIELEADRLEVAPDRNEVALVTVKVVDAKGRTVPTAEDLIEFELTGPGKIIGVGNGNPSSLEPDVYVETVWSQDIGEWNPPNPADSKTPLLWEAQFDAPDAEESVITTLLFNLIGENQTVVLNGEVIASEILERGLALKPGVLKPTGNTLRIEATPFPVWRDREGIFEVHPAFFKFEKPAPKWKRSVFNGLAQVIIQAQPDSGTIYLKATGEHLEPATIAIVVK